MEQDRITEQNNPRSKGFSRLSTAEMLRVINSEDQTVALAVEKELDAIAAAADAASANLAAGGRMYYFGAGTSGRLGIIDAGELPCTYGVPREMVQAIIAGGPEAVYDAAMGDEDSCESGYNEALALKIGAADVIIGIAASGQTPYVLGAVRAGKEADAVTIGICNNKASRLAWEAAYPIAVETGPEVIEGSTRMKAGTAQKMVLNMLSTVIMTRLGYVYGNYMVRMQPNNAKLYERAAHIVRMCTRASSDACREALAQCGQRIDTAILMILLNLSVEKADGLLKAHAYSIDRVLDAQLKS